jgi:two-component sensor histidine kinase
MENAALGRTDDQPRTGKHGRIEKVRSRQPGPRFQRKRGTPPPAPPRNFALCGVPGTCIGACEFGFPVLKVALLRASEPASQMWRPEHLRLAIDAACVALWSWHVDTNQFTMDQRAFELWGLPWAAQVSFEKLSSHIHPADRDRVRAAFSATRSVAGAYEIDFRIMLGEEVRWVSARGQGADAGIVDRVMFGIFLDVTGRKQAEEGHELLAGEMSHRVKNLLAIATALTEITSRSAVTISDMSRELIQRLTALGRAHDLVRPLPGKEGTAALLGDLLSVLLAPYEDPGAFSGRIRVAVPRMGVGEATATSLAMVVHELATNSMKHGALSAHTGALDISSRIEDADLTLIWAETGGPAVTKPAEMSGFGSKMISRQLGGAINFDWQPTGLVVTLRIRKDRLST